MSDSSAMKTSCSLFCGKNWKTLQSSRNGGYGNHDNHDVSIILLLYTYVYMLALCYYVCVYVYACYSACILF